LFTEANNQLKLMVVKRSVTIIFVRVTLQKIIRRANTEMSYVNFVKIVVTY
jgi:hypothetical protein